MPGTGHPPRSSVYGSHSFYVRIAVIIAGLLLITAAPIISYNYIENRRIVLGLSDNLMDQVSNTILEKTAVYFLPASAIVEISAKLTELGAVSVGNYGEMELYTMGMLHFCPQIAMFFVADEEGNSIQAWRQPDGGMQSRVIRPDSSALFKRWDAKFKMYESRPGDIIDYDPRVRPWYMGAKAAGSSYWTDVYILHDGKKPAITSAFPFYDGNGRFAGVWAANAEIDEMSKFLKGLKVGKSGIAFIINQKDEVVAYPDASRAMVEENGVPRTARIEELGIDQISAAYRHHAGTGKSKAVVESGGRRYFYSFIEFPKEFYVNWKVALVVPEDDFTSDAEKLMKETILIGSVILGFSILLAILVARGISRPIKLLSGETNKIRNFDLGEKVTITSRIKEIQLMSDAISAMKAGLQAFKRYVPAELVRRLIETGEEARLGGHKRDLTVFFSDIAGFTTIAERMSPEELMLHLSEYFDELTKILSAHKATVDKYIGDAILAFWGAPIPDDDHAVNACAAALACREKIADLNRRWESEGRSPFITRIGISTGETVVGNVGSSERINYTVMGDNVNLASRLEGANKFYHSGIIVSRNTREAASERFLFRLLGVTAVKGKSEGSAIYELMGAKAAGPGAENAEAAALCEGFTGGVEAYLAGEWDAACEIFTNLAARFPSDAPTRFYLSRCRHFRDNPPGAHWRGVEYLESK
ncbi:MAG: adenylate/guanylate cyclase domain-containing protein [Syntrophobacteraceae bacterium]